MSDPLRVLIADDHAPTRAGIRLALEAGGCQVCYEAANADDAIEGARRLRPEVCILDLSMPGGGIRAVGEITAGQAPPRVIVLTVSADPNDLFDALRAGAAGYLLKDMDPAELPDLVRRTARGEGALPGSLTAHLIDQFRTRGSGRTVTLDDGRRVELTARERDVLELLADDVPTSEMAQRLFVSTITVRRHVSMLLHKLEVQSREDAGRMVTRRTGHRRDDPPST
jgi:DNA-binding NarL/FixJ family response regulator